MNPYQNTYLFLHFYKNFSNFINRLSHLCIFKNLIFQFFKIFMLLVHNIFRQTPQIKTKFYGHSFYYLFAFIFAINHIIIIAQRCDIDTNFRKIYTICKLHAKSVPKTKHCKNFNIFLASYTFCSK